MSDDDKKDNHELTDEEVKNHLEAWEKFKEEFPKLPFPRNFSNEAKFGTDWFDHLLDLDRDDPMFETSLNVGVLMEQFCWFVKEKKEIPLPLSSFVARAFKDFLRNGKSLEQGFLLKGDGSGQKVKRNYDGHPFPIPLGHYFWAVVVDGLDPVEAKKVIQKEDNVKKSTLNDYIDNERLVRMAVGNVIASVEAYEYRHLNKNEQERIANIIPNFKYIPMIPKEHLLKQKEKDEEELKRRIKEDRKNRLIKQWKLDEL